MFLKISDCVEGHEEAGTAAGYTGGGHGLAAAPLLGPDLRARRPALPGRLRALEHLGHEQPAGRGFHVNIDCLVYLYTSMIVLIRRGVLSDQLSL